MPLNRFLTFCLSTLLLGIALVAVSLALWRHYEEQRWNDDVDQFEKLQNNLHQPVSEVDILVRLLRQNPWHSLWKEFEFAPIFSGDKFGLYGGFHISWPRQTIQLGEESVHVLTSQHPCNGRKLLVHTDADSRILDVQIVSDIYNIDTLKIQVVTLKPHPVIRLTCLERFSSDYQPFVQNLTFTKS